MASEMTAAAWITPRTERVMHPEHLLILLENFVPTWVGRRIDAGPTAPSVVIAGAPRHQFASGLLAHLWMCTPARVAREDRLASLLTVTHRGVTVVPLSTSDAHHVYTTLAPLARVDLTLHPGTCITDRDVQHARRCGLRLFVADARHEPAERSA